MAKYNDMKKALEILTAKNTLLQLAKEAGATVSFFDGNTCVNGSLPTGDFICCSCQETLLDNIIHVTNWIADRAYPPVGATQEWCKSYDEDPQYWYEYFVYRNHSEEEAYEIIYGEPMYEPEEGELEGDDEHYMKLAEMYADGKYNDDGAWL